jgi:hypothetical protein
MSKKQTVKKPVKKTEKKQEFDNEMKMVCFSNQKRTKETDPAMYANFQIEGEKHFVGLKSRLSEKGKQYYKGTKNDIEVILFINEEKEDKQPDLRGKINVGDSEWFVSLWKNESDKGVKYLSGLIQPPYEGGKPKDKNKVNQPNNKGQNFFNDLPF